MDVGLTHVALVVSDVDRSVPFYARYCGMQVVHRRGESGAGAVVWLSDLTRPFVVVLVSGDLRVESRLGPFGHLGIGCESRARVDELAALAASEGILRLGPTDSGPPVGYWVLIGDPDGHTIELSYGQEVGLAVFGDFRNARSDR